MTKDFPSPSIFVVLLSFFPFFLRSGVFFLVCLCIFFSVLLIYSSQKKNEKGQKCFLFSRFFFVLLFLNTLSMSVLCEQVPQKQITTPSPLFLSPFYLHSFLTHGLGGLQSRG